MKTLIFGYITELLGKLLHVLLLGWLIRKNSNLTSENDQLTAKLESSNQSHQQEQTAEEAANAVNSTKPSQIVTPDNGLDFTSFNNRP